MRVDGLLTPRKKARFYRCFRRVSAQRDLKWFIKTEILPHQPKRILDLGCGTSDILAYLNNIEYIGIDPNQSYIDSAQSRYPSRGQWQCGPVTMDTVALSEVLTWFCCLACCTTAQMMPPLTCSGPPNQPFKKEGIVLHLDGCLHAEAKLWFETMLYRLERGLYVRNQEGYATLMTQDLRERSAAGRRWPAAIAISILCGQRPQQIVLVHTESIS